MSPRMPKDYGSIEVRDSSPLDTNLSEEHHRWLRELGVHLRSRALVIRLGGTANEHDPVIRYDESSGKWWSGRYVGVVNYKGRTLTIRPRYEFALRHWMTRVWNCYILPGLGTVDNSHVWIWNLIAMIWAQQLIKSAKHGLPYVRVHEQNTGQTIRGKLDVRKTAVEMAQGGVRVISTSRVRQMADDIGGILWLAYARLRNELRAQPEQTWLSARGVELISQLRSTGVSRGKTEHDLLNTQIRYTPINESYRKSVDLSKAILRDRAFATNSGDSEVSGALIDIAEIWEMYVFRLIAEAVPSPYDVIHLGRVKSSELHLLHSRNGSTLANLKPDIVVRVRDEIAAVVDAKYKSTLGNSNRPSGLHREDLYQMTSYLAAMTDKSQQTPGILVYPDDGTGRIGEYQEQGPWTVGVSGLGISLLGIAIAREGEAAIEHAEHTFKERILALMQERNVN